jgi:ATP-dependent Clp protease ATP-binding subunit ClpC
MSNQIFYFTSIGFVILVLLSLYCFYISNIGLGQLILALALLIEVIGLTQKYASSKTLNSTNLAEKITDEVAKLFEKAIHTAKSEGLTEITPELCFDEFSEVKFGRIIFMRLGLIYPPKKPGRAKPGNNPVFSQNLVGLIGQITQKNDLNLEDLLTGIVKNSKSIQDYLSNLNILPSDIDKVISWEKDIRKAIKPNRFWENEKMLSGIGEDWAYGYTPALSIYSVDLSRYFGDLRLEIDVFGHLQKLDEIQSILVRARKNNCLLVGEPGVGKKTIINALALKLARGDSLPQLKHKRIRQLDVGRLLAGANPGELAARLQEVLGDAVHAGNIVLYIDNFQSLLDGGNNNEIGGTDATQALIPFLESSNLKIIASVTPTDFFEKVKANSTVSGAFEKIDVNPPSADDTLAILLEMTSQVEFKNNVYFPIQTLKKIIELSDRYIHEVPFPEKSIRLMEEASVGYSSEKMRLVSPEEIEALVSRKVNIPIGSVQEKEKDKLLDLETLLHKRVIGQNEAIDAVANTLRRIRAGLSSGKRPSGVFLFLGPTGVGKTETAKALAETYFGSEKRMIRLDMSEYQTPESIDRLVGTVSNPSGILTDAISENPFSEILLDEIEKADKNVLNLFLQVFEDGRLTDPRGRVSDFTNSIIISTSNAGAQFIREKVQNTDLDDIKDKLLEKLQTDNVFSPEFINRFDGVIVFKPLTEEELTQVANLMIDNLNKGLEEKKVSVEVAPDALKELVRLGYDPQYGARPMRRVIQEKIENLLAKKMLDGSVAKGGTCKISLNDIR